MEIRSFALRSWAEVLVTRRLGEDLRQRILTALPRRNKPESLLLDFSDLRIVDYSCADELVARLAIELQHDLHGERFLLLKGLDETVQENIGVALKQRGIALLCSQDEETSVWSLLGEMKPYLKQALDLLNERGEITARDLADEAGVAINTASNHLAELAKIGMAYRRSDSLASGGKQFQYTSILPQSTDPLPIASTDA